MGDRFGQFNRAVYRRHLAWLDLNPALLFAVRAVDPSELLQSDIACPLFLNGSAESLTELMSGQLDLIKMRDFIALLKGLNLRRNAGGFFEVVIEFFLQLRLVHIHAIDS